MYKNVLAQFLMTMFSLVFLGVCFVAGFWLFLIVAGLVFMTSAFVFIASLLGFFLRGGKLTKVSTYNYKITYTDNEGVEREGTIEE